MNRYKIETVTTSGSKITSHVIATSADKAIKMIQVIIKNAEILHLTLEDETEKAD
jgi:hypothetical protein